MITIVAQINSCQHLEHLYGFEMLCSDNLSPEPSAAYVQSQMELCISDEVLDDLYMGNPWLCIYRR